MTKFLDFERPIADLEGKIEELKHLSSNGDLNIADEISRLQAKAEKLMRQTYGSLTAWQKVQISRHPDRPKFFDYVTLFDNFVALAGDRTFGEDCAIVGGLAKFNGQSVMIMGHQKGTDTESRVKHNFGMAKPEGYRKARRLMEMANKFHLPILTFVDTAGAYPGIDAEERGQAEAIARCLETCLTVKVPLISVIIGEGGSGGAIALAAANTVIMLEHSVYSVISPEGCASILWRSGAKAPEAADAQRLTAQDLMQLGVIDRIVPEPIGGAQRFKLPVLKAVKESLAESLKPFANLDGTAILSARRDKFVKMGNKGIA
jgi:acetyl-CoA carboxylase carboxyl transferase subunit alpha